MVSAYVEQYTIGKRGLMLISMDGDIIIFHRETISNLKIYKTEEGLVFEIKDTVGDTYKFVLADGELNNSDVKLLKELLVL